jgi:hypothetical protein
MSVHYKATFRSKVSISFQGRINIAGKEKGRKSSVSNSLTLSIASVIPSTLKMEATRGSETTIYIKPTRPHNPDD